MKNSYNRLIQKPKSAQVSKKNSSISSVLYKQIGDTLKEYKDNKQHTKRNDRDHRCVRNSNHNIYDRQNNIRGSNQQIKSKNYGNNNNNNNNMTMYMNGNGNGNGNMKVNNQVEEYYKKQQAMPFKNMNNNFINIKSQDHAAMIFQHKKSSKNIMHAYQQTINQLKLNEPTITAKTSKKSFLYKYIIGKGGFGKVWKVQHNKTRNQYAMKQMLKSLVMTKKSIQSVMNQRILLAGLNSPFIVNMHYAFQDRDTLYLVLDLLEGGDLRHHISTKRFTQIQAKFFISCIILGLEYLHHNKIIHRDIKPQNLVLDSRGYVRITDLGIARIKKSCNSCDTSGTPGYMSPQVICRMNHSFVSDFYAVGVIAYELATGKRPHNGISRNQIRQQILAKQVLLKPHEIPEDWSQDCIDFVNRLIQRKQQQRLGFTGIQQLKNHPWIKQLNWKKLASRDIQSPFIPLMKKSDFDQDEQITIEDEQQAEMIEKNSLLLRKPEFQELFKQYFFEPSQPQKSQKQVSRSRQKTTKSQAQSMNKASTPVEQNRRKNSAGSYNPHPNQISTKNSCVNLKKTNISTNNSIEVSTSNISGMMKNLPKTPEISSRNPSGNVVRKADHTNRQSKDNVLNVSQCVQAYGISYKPGKQKQKEKPFFRL